MEPSQSRCSGHQPGGAKRSAPADSPEMPRPLASVPGPSGSPCQKKHKAADLPTQLGSSQERAGNRAGKARLLPGSEVVELGQASVVDNAGLIADCNETSGTNQQKDTTFGEASGAEVCGAEHKKLDGTVAERENKSTSKIVCRKTKGAGFVQNKLSTGQASRQTAVRVHLANLKNIRGSFTGTAINYRLPCTADEEGRTCQIVGQLSTWNEFLCKAHLELREMPGTRSQLSLSACLQTGQFLATKKELHQAVSLTYWLLKTHRCVVALDIPSSLLLETVHAAVLSNALEDSSSVRSLTVRLPSRLELPHHFCSVISSLTQLEEFEYVDEFWVPPSLLTTALGLLLQATASLTCLRIPTLRCRDSSDAAIFLAFLHSNSTLQELSFHGSLIETASHASKRVFEDYVRNTKTLTSLTVSGYATPLEDCIYWILNGIGANKSLSEVSLVRFGMDAPGAAILPVVLKQNNTLRSFSMTQVCPDNDMGTSPNKYYSLLEVLTHIETLEGVTLPVHIWNDEQWKLFFNALAKNRNLKDVTIELDPLSRSERFQVYTDLKESGAAKKVIFKSSSYLHRPPFSPITIPSKGPITIPSKGFSDLYVGPGHESSRERLSRMVQQLPSYTDITSIDLDIHQSHWDYAQFKVFTNYVESTTMLRQLRVTSRVCYIVLEPDAMTKRFWMLLICSLSQNTSVRELSIEMRVNEEVARDLGDLIKTSRNIRKVHMNAFDHRATVAFIQHLCVAIADNYRLTHVTLEDCKPITEEGWFAIRSVAARNSSLVTRAAQYMAGAACDRYRAHALEKVSRSPPLMEEVAELATISNSEAIKKVREGLRSFEGLHDFMRFCRVVREKVVCHPRLDGRMQLDELNEHCWSKVRHYLSVEDVRESNVRPGSLPTQ